MHCNMIDQYKDRLGGSLGVGSNSPHFSTSVSGPKRTVRRRRGRCHHSPRLGRPPRGHGDAVRTVPPNSSGLEHRNRKRPCRRFGDSETRFWQRPDRGLEELEILVAPLDPRCLIDDDHFRRVGSEVLRDRLNEALCAAHLAGIAVAPAIGETLATRRLQHPLSASSCARGRNSMPDLHDLR
jgi:hypothetical protein